MNIRKHWQKIVLAVAASFWASCGDSESSTAPETQGPRPASSASIEPESSAEPYSSETEELKLASDTTVTCNQVVVSDTSKMTCAAPDTMKTEDTMLVVVPLYGCSITETKSVVYECDNGMVYPKMKDGKVYTAEEYEELFPESSSSQIEPKSSGGMEVVPLYGVYVDFE